MNASARSEVSQQVTATSGFAYGVIDGDIHVFGDGTPVYLLKNWDKAPHADPEWLRELPSRMLNARFAVVDFTGRQDELTRLHNWRQTGPRLAAHWLYGPGGAGKTRLAAQFAAEAAAAGWKVVTAAHVSGTVQSPPGSQNMALGGAMGLLMIVDYADGWPHSHLTWLFSNAILHQFGVPSRVLLIARTADLWPGLRGSLANHQAGTSSQLLEPLPDADGHRADMFTAARNTFASRYHLDNPASVTSPTDFNDPDMGLTLALHVAALVAVDAHATGQRPPRDMAGLTIYLLDREHAHWVNLYDNTTGDESGQNGFYTPPDLMDRAAFTAALSGPVPHHFGTRIIGELHLPIATESILSDHAKCYPPTCLAEDTVLEPIYPDRLAEDFLALTIPGHTVEYPAQPWARASVTALVSSFSDSRNHLDCLSRSVAFLAAATRRWPHVGRTYLFPALCEDPQLAVTAGSKALSEIAAITDIDISVLMRIEETLPVGPHVDLSTGAAAINAALMPHISRTSSDPAELAHAYRLFATRLKHAGRLQEAVDQARQCVRIYRELADADPNGRLPELAASLSDLSSLLAEAGHREEAVVRAQSAVDLLRTLAESNPDALLPELARALSALGNAMSQLGRREEALAPAEEGTAIYRKLAAADSEDWLPDHATALTNLAALHWQTGSMDRALTIAEEGLVIRRRLAAANPDVVLPELAVSLSNLAALLLELDRRQDALARAEEAVGLLRPLVNANPDARLPELAKALSNLANALSRMGRRGEAVASAEEAVQIFRRFAAANPAAGLPLLATSLCNLGGFLSDIATIEDAPTRQEDAFAPLEEAIAIRRRMAESEPEAWLPELAMSLVNLGTFLARGGEGDRALPWIQEAADHYLELSKDNPSRWLHYLARSLVALEKAIGKRENASQIWDGVIDQLPVSVRTRWRILRAGWGWLTADLYGGEKAERDWLRDHPILLEHDSDEWLRQDILCYYSPQQVRRYLSILDRARHTDVDIAYREIGQFDGT